MYLWSLPTLKIYHYCFYNNIAGWMQLWGSFAVGEGDDRSMCAVGVYVCCWRNFFLWRQATSSDYFFRFPDLRYLAERLSLLGDINKTLILSLDCLLITIHVWVATMNTIQNYWQFFSVIRSYVKKSGRFGWCPPQNGLTPRPPQLWSAIVWYLIIY